jgi:hypothetical protein
VQEICFAHDIENFGKSYHITNKQKGGGTHSNQKTGHIDCPFFAFIELHTCSHMHYEPDSVCSERNFTKFLGDEVGFYW